MNLERSLHKLTTVAKVFSSMETCTTLGCNKPVSKPGYKLCYECWKANNSQSRSAPQPRSKAPSSPLLLSATQISEKLALHNRNVNRILAELGLLDKEQNGWVATRRGIGFGAVQKTYSQTGNPYVLWPESILENQVFIKTLAEYVNSDSSELSGLKISDAQRGRDKLPPGQLRTTDGHWVRSRAEVIIDNCLYTAGVVHAYERRLPIEEEVYCDFYLPTGKVYIEYWGLENNPEYSARKKVKQEIYHKYEFDLIELSDEHIKNLDDYLPRLLLKFGIAVS